MAQLSSNGGAIARPNKTVDVRLADLATVQHRVVEYSQLRALGLGPEAIRHRVRRGRLQVIHRGVYAVGHRDIGRDGFLMAAVLACGKGALLSHRTGADHRGVIHTSSPAIHVTVPGRNRPAVKGVVVHLTRRLPDVDRTLVDGIPVTSMARTLLDFAGVARPGELIPAIEQAQRMRLFDMRAIDEVLGRSRGRRGAAALRRALFELSEDAPDLRSPLEERFRSYCRARKLPMPAFNVTVAGFLVDAVWFREKVADELEADLRSLLQ